MTVERVVWHAWAHRLGRLRGGRWTTRGTDSVRWVPAPPPLRLVHGLAPEVW